MTRIALLLISILTFAGSSSAFAQADAAALRTKLQAAMTAKDYESMVTTGKALVALDPKDSTGNFAVGVALHTMGKLDEAIPYHEAAAAGTGEFTSVGAYNAGCAYSLKGNADKAFEWLDKAVALGFSDLRQVRGDADLKNLQADPRFADFLAKLGAKPVKKAEMKVLNQSTPRILTRVSAFTPSFDACLGEVAIEYGPVAWKADHQKDLEAGKLDGQRWRLGTDFWTNLDSNTTFTLGGTKFMPGDYYLVLERTADTKKFLLTLLPTDDIRKLKADAFEAAGKAKGGVSVEMAHEDIQQVADKLSIKLTTDSNASTSGKLTIEYGPHRLTTPFTLATN